MQPHTFDKLRLTARVVILLRRRQAYSDRWSLSKYVRKLTRK